MSQENVEIVRPVYEAVARGDSASVLALFDADVEIGSRLPEARLVGSGANNFRRHTALSARGRPELGSPS